MPSTSPTIQKKQFNLYGTEITEKCHKPANLEFMLNATDPLGIGVALVQKKQKTCGSPLHFGPDFLTPLKNDIVLMVSNF